MIDEGNTRPLRAQEHEKLKPHVLHHPCMFTCVCTGMILVMTSCLGIYQAAKRVAC